MQQLNALVMTSNTTATFLLFFDAQNFHWQKFSGLLGAQNFWISASAHQIIYLCESSHHFRIKYFPLIVSYIMLLSY